MFLFPQSNYIIPEDIKKRISWAIGIGDPESFSVFKNWYMNLATNPLNSNFLIDLNASCLNYIVSEWSRLQVELINNNDLLYFTAKLYSRYDGIIKPAFFLGQLKKSFENTITTQRINTLFLVLFTILPHNDEFFHSILFTQKLCNLMSIAYDGDSEAQFISGYCYFHGFGVNKDLTQAIKYYQLAAGQGHAPAQTVLGYCYFHGFGVNKDLTQAVKYCQLAAGQGHAPAQTDLGNCYFHGTGVNKDLTQAVKYYQLAAGQGFAPAQKKLGDCYHTGYGARRYLPNAAYYYTLAAQQGLKPAMMSLEFLLISLRGRSTSAVMNTRGNKRKSTTIGLISQRDLKRQRTNMAQSTLEPLQTIPLSEESFQPEITSTTDSGTQQPYDGSNYLSSLHFFSPTSKTTDLSIPNDLVSTKGPVLKIDINIVKKIIAILRGNYNTSNNCIHLARDLLKYFQTGQIPSDPSSIKASTQNDFQVLLGINAIKKEHDDSIDLSKAYAYEVVTHSIVDRSSSILFDDIDLNIPCDIEQPQTPDGTIDLEGKPVINIESFRQPSAKYDELNEKLKQEANDADSGISYGLVNLARCDKHVDKDGHTIVYYATSQQVWYIDCQQYDGIKKIDHGSVFSNLNDIYTFTHNGIDDDINTFGKYVFYIPIITLQAEPEQVPLKEEKITDNKTITVGL